MQLKNHFTIDFKVNGFIFANHRSTQLDTCTFTNFVRSYHTPPLATNFAMIVQYRSKIRAQFHLLPQSSIKTKVIVLLSNVYSQKQL